MVHSHKHIGEEEYVEHETTFPPSVGEKSKIDFDHDYEITISIILRSPVSGRDNEYPADAEHPRMSYAAFEQRRGARPEDVEAILAFSSYHDLNIVEISRVRRTVIVSGTVQQFSKIFKVKLEHHQENGKIFRVQQGALYIPRSLRAIVIGIFGLDNRPFFEPNSVPFIPNLCKSGMSTSFNPPQVAAAYMFPQGVTGKGQTIAILELGGGYTITDMTTYFQQISVALPSITAVSVNGGKNQPDGNLSRDDMEVCMDIQVCGSIAPGADIFTFFAPNSLQGLLDSLTAAIHHSSRPSVISISWASTESNCPEDFLNSFTAACQDAAWLGITIVVSSGDKGSTNNASDGLAHVQFPASCPYVLSCGGTTIQLATNGIIIRETVWNNACGMSGGGISDFFNVPNYQSAFPIPVSINPNMRIGRGVPDVSGNADPDSGYNLFCDGTKFIQGGTSAVAPLWAAFIALMNEWLGQNLGFVNNRFYNLWSSKFRDISIGNNGGYTAATGWDACTGLGSPSGVGLLSAIQVNRMGHSIIPVKSNCGLFGIQGGTITLVSDLVAVPPLAKIAYSWKVTGGNATIIGKKDQYSVVLAVPTDNNPVIVSVHVIVDLDSFTDTFTFTPLDPTLAIRLEKFCKLRMYVHHNMFIRPLWDPLRDLVTMPLLPSEIEEMSKVIDELSNLLHDIKSTGVL